MSVLIFKILLLVFEALHGLASAYSSDILVMYEAVRLLRSSGTSVLLVLKTFIEATFSLYNLGNWKSLPEELLATLN